MTARQSFPPLLGPRPRLLILGSMPGEASLRAGQYYAHPRNLFWPLMAEMLDFEAALPYAQRVARLQAAGVAVWDVLAHCRRRGSLDAAIERGSEQANAIPALLAAQPQLGHVFLNGRAAEALFRRHLLAAARAARPTLAITALPSTSPANQSIPLAQRRAAWQQVAEALAASGAGRRRQLGGIGGEALHGEGDPRR